MKKALFLISIGMLLYAVKSTAQQGPLGHDWGGFEGTIDVWSEDCDILIETTQPPSHPDDLLNCRYEWSTRVNGILKSGILGYVECDDMDVFKFDPPIEADSFNVRKRVTWHNSSGTKWRTTAQTTVFPDCSDNLVVPVTHSHNLKGGKINVESKIKFVLVNLGPYGFTVDEFQPGVYQINPDNYFGDIFYLIFEDKSEFIFSI